jgi:thioredoxin 1
MFKKIVPWMVIVFLAAVFIIAFALKDTMNKNISELMKQQASSEITTSGLALVDSLFNYTKNGGTYQISFLEFGSTFCPACKRMESVMEEVKAKYPDKVNVIFLSILKPENQVLMQYYGIPVIPTQVLLDKQGNEFFRHSGFISTGDLEKIYRALLN